MLAVCDCPTCPERGVIDEMPGDHRCPVCGWLVRRLVEEDEEEEAE